MESVAGLALLTTFAASLHAAMSSAADRIAAALALLLAASGLSIAGVSSAFWALVVGLVVHVVVRPREAAAATLDAQDARAPDDEVGEAPDDDILGEPVEDQPAR